MEHHLQNVFEVHYFLAEQVLQMGFLALILYPVEKHHFQLQIVSQDVLAHIQKLQIASDERELFLVFEEEDPPLEHQAVVEVGEVFLRTQIVENQSFASIETARNQLLELPL